MSVCSSQKTSNQQTRILFSFLSCSTGCGTSASQLSLFLSSPLLCPLVVVYAVFECPQILPSSEDIRMQHSKRVHSAAYTVVLRDTKIQIIKKANTGVGYGPVYRLALGGSVPGVSFPQIH